MLAKNPLITSQNDPFYVTGQKSYCCCKGEITQYHDNTIWIEMINSQQSLTENFRLSFLI